MISAARAGLAQVALLAQREGAARSQSGGAFPAPARMREPRLDGSTDRALKQVPDRLAARGSAPTELAAGAIGGDFQSSHGDFPALR